MAKKSFQMYSDYRGAFEALSDEQAGQIIKALFAHEDGDDFPLDGALRSAFVLITNQLDRDREKYEETCERNRKNGQMGGRPAREESQNNRAVVMGSAEKPQKPDTDTDTEPDTDKDTDKVCADAHALAAAPGTHTRSRFVTPTMEAVSAYCTQRNNAVDAQRFVDFYASKGWVVGKSPMKDWRAAVRTWEQEGRASPQTKGYEPDEQYRFGR